MKAKYLFNYNRCHIKSQNHSKSLSRKIVLQWYYQTQFVDSDDDICHIELAPKHHKHEILKMIHENLSIFLKYGWWWCCKDCMYPFMHICKVSLFWFMLFTVGKTIRFLEQN